MKRIKNALPKLLFTMLMLVMTVGLFGCSKQEDPKELFDKANEETNTKIESEMKNIVSENTVLKRSDEILKADSHMNLKIDATALDANIPNSIDIKNSPESKALSLSASVLEQDMALYLTDDRLVADVFGQTLYVPTQAFGASLEEWLTANGMAQAMSSFNGVDIKGLNIGYSDLIKFGESTQFINPDNYKADIEELKSIATYKLGKEADIELAGGTVKAKTVNITVARDKFNAWFDKVVAKLEADTELNNYFDMLETMSKAGQTDTMTKEEFINEIKDINADNTATVALNVYVVDNTIRRYELVEDASSDVIRLDLLGKDNLTDKVLFYINTAGNEEVTLTLEGNIIPKDNKIDYSIKSITDGTESNYSIKWDIANTEGDNLALNMDGQEFKLSATIDSANNIVLKSTSQADVVCTIQPLTEAIVVPEASKNIFEMGMQDLYTMFLPFVS